MTDKITIERETLERAIDALVLMLQWACDPTKASPGYKPLHEAIERLRAALAAQPAQSTMTLAEFCAEGDRLGVTAADLADALKDRPEFADCRAAQPAEPVASDERLKADNANLRTVMIAAAEEIHAHWDAHCNAEGYGPANLMRRLEEGIPAEYGYTAGAFAEQRERIASLLAELERWKRCATELAVASKAAAPPAPAAVPLTDEQLLISMAVGCRCDENEKPENDCRQPCKARMAQDALNEASDIMSEAVYVIKRAHDIAAGDKP